MKSKQYPPQDAENGSRDEAKGQVSKQRSHTRADREPQGEKNAKMGKQSAYEGN